MARRQTPAQVTALGRIRSGEHRTPATPGGPLRVINFEAGHQGEVVLCHRDCQVDEQVFTEMYRVHPDGQITPV